MQSLPWQIFTTGGRFALGDLSFEAFPVSHDAYEPVGFIVTCGSTMVGIATDIGTSTHLVTEKLRPCRVILLECNHDEQLLSGAKRPWVLKQRIAGRLGHLSNRHAAEMVAEIASPSLTDVFLCHLSRDCNRPELALKEVNKILARRNITHIRVHLTYAGKNSAVWSDEAQ
jgi:phosphoribosyl 1,2-cyclic phosphodiesterase